MIEFLPVSGHLVADHDASTVIAPAYDALDPEQRRAHVRAHPESFLSVIRPSVWFGSGLPCW